MAGAHHSIVGDLLRADGKNSARPDMPERTPKTTCA